MGKKRSKNIRVNGDFAFSLKEFADLSGVKQVKIAERLIPYVPVVVKEELKGKKKKLEKVTEKSFWEEFRIFRE